MKLIPRCRDVPPSRRRIRPLSFLPPRRYAFFFETTFPGVMYKDCVSGKALVYTGPPLRCSWPFSTLQTLAKAAHDGLREALLWHRPFLSISPPQRLFLEALKTLCRGNRPNGILVSAAQDPSPYFFPPFKIAETAFQFTAFSPLPSYPPSEASRVVRVTHRKTGLLS